MNCTNEVRMRSRASGEPGSLIRYTVLTSNPALRRTSDVPRVAWMLNPRSMRSCAIGINACLS